MVLIEVALRDFSVEFILAESKKHFLDVFNVFYLILGENEDII